VCTAQAQAVGINRKGGIQQEKACHGTCFNEKWGGGKKKVELPFAPCRDQHAKGNKKNGVSIAGGENKGYFSHWVVQAEET